MMKKKKPKYFDYFAQCMKNRQFECMECRVFHHLCVRCRHTSNPWHHATHLFELSTWNAADIQPHISHSANDFHSVSKSQIKNQNADAMHWWFGIGFTIISKYHTTFGYKIPSTKTQTKSIINTLGVHYFGAKKKRKDSCWHNFFRRTSKINYEKLYKITSKIKLMIVNIFPIKLYLSRDSSNTKTVGWFFLCDFYRIGRNAIRIAMQCKQKHNRTQIKQMDEKKFLFTSIK